MNNPACTPEPSAMSTTTENAVNAVCVDLIDHGNVETPWGIKPRIELVFETVDGQECPQFISRTFNNYAYKKSALTEAVRQWLDHDISEDDGDSNLSLSKGRCAQLEIEATFSASGNRYWKITAIKPAGTISIHASGTYLREMQK